MHAPVSNLQPDDYAFEFKDVEHSATQHVQEALAEGRGITVVGAGGVGKSHAVARAVGGALWAEVPRAPFAVPRVLCDLAAQAGDHGKVLHAYVTEGASSACASLDRILGNRVMVLDGVEPLWSVKALTPFDEPEVTALWANEVEALREWACDRVRTTPTVLIGRHLPDAPNAVACTAPTEWPVKLSQSALGYVPWRDVSARLGMNPAGLFLAAATLRMAGPDTIERWLYESAECGPREATVRLSEHFLHAAPFELTRTLASISSAGEVGRAVLDDLALVDDDLSFGLDLARDLRLLEERGGVTRVLSVLKGVNANPAPHDHRVDPLLRRLITRLLTPINDRGSLDPSRARDVLDAHRLQLAIGDLDGALTTARLHVGGLVAYAREASLAANTSAEFDHARRTYAQIRALLNVHPRAAEPIVRSYVSHYHGYNGHRARTLGLDDVARDYDQAIETWPVNALWHARRIALAAEQGDAARARQLADVAAQAVPEHPRKAGYLALRAAKWSSDAGAELVAFDLLEDYVPPPNLQLIDPVASQYRQRLLGRWARGVECARLQDTGGRDLVFHRPLRLAVEPVEGGWSAWLEFPSLRATGPGPSSAVKAAAAAMADECLTLVQTPTARLPSQKVTRKGQYLGVIDLVSSEIGLPFHTHRWLLGTVSGSTFTPSQVDLDPLQLAPGVAPSTQSGAFLAKVSTDRTGHPAGPVERLVEAGAGRDLRELLFVFKRLAESGDDAA